jgi:probable biosynthetic protein (TIGR04098 family)
MDMFTRIQALIGGVLKNAPVPLARDTELIQFDSLSLVILREECEKEFGIFIPDADWHEIGTISELLDLIERLSASSAGNSAGGAGAQGGASQGLPTWNSDDMAEPLEIGMPLMGIGNLCESALLKHLGDVRWRHITRLTGVPSRNLLDDEGNRLYPAFFYVELQFPESKPMGSFGENDTLVVMDTVKRYGLSMLDGTVYLIPSESRQFFSKPLTSLEEAARAGIPAVRLSNAFVMKFDGAEWLKKSRPKIGTLDTVAELPSPPDSFELCKRVQKGGGLSAPFDNFRAVHDADVTFQYAIQPDRDVNGVGLLYFANYPLFLDLAERHALKQAYPPWPDALINARSLLVRKVVYLNNAAWNDSMEIRTRSWMRLSPESGSSRDPFPCSALRLASEQRIYRQSDGRMMCVSWSEKIVSSQSDELRALIKSF